MEGRRKVADFDENLGRIKVIIREGIDIEKFISLARSAQALDKPERKYI